MSEPRVEWVDRANFAEVAEALGISTKYVLGVHADGNVIWTPSEEDDGDLWVGQLRRRRDDNVLVVTNRRFLSTVDDFQDQIDEKIREALD